MVSRLEQPEFILDRAGDIDVDATIERWLAILAQMMPVTGAEQRDICNELAAHLHERTRDLVLNDHTDAEALRRAFDELGELADLAHRFEHALHTPRRRKRMNALLIGLGITTLTTSGLFIGTQLGTPAPVDLAAGAQRPAMTNVQENTVQLHDAKRSRDKADRILLDVEYDDMPVEEALARIDGNVGPAFEVHWRNLEDCGITRSTVVKIRCFGCSLRDVLDQLTAALSADSEVAIEWRLANNTVHIDMQWSFDRTEATLETYSVLTVLESIANTDDLSIQDATSSLMDLVYTMVEPDLWDQNGGDLAMMKLVNGRLFVQAPPRVHERVMWILTELRRDSDEQASRESLRDAAAELDTMRAHLTHAMEDFAVRTRQLEAEKADLLDQLAKLNPHPPVAIAEPAETH
jgi:hypothetical protein